MHPAQKKAYQSMTSQQKLKVALDLYYSAKTLKAAGLRNQHPDWTEEEIQQKVHDIFSDAGAKSI